MSKRVSESRESPQFERPKGESTLNSDKSMMNVPFSQGLFSDNLHKFLIFIWKFSGHIQKKEVHFENWEEKKRAIDEVSQLVQKERKVNQDQLDTLYKILLSHKLPFLTALKGKLSKEKIDLLPFDNPKALLEAIAKTLDG